MADNITLATQIMGVASSDVPRIPHWIAKPTKQYHEIFDRYGIEGAYFIFDVEPNQIGDFIKGAQAMKMAGVGVTMPHKSTAVPYIDHLSETAKACNAVNLVVFRDGESYGYMTDGTGYCGEWDARGVSLEGRNVTIIGAGAIVPTICYELAKRNVAGFRILNQTRERGEKTAQKVREVTGKDVEFLELTDENLTAAAPETQLLINCTPRGMNADHGPQWEKLDFMDKLPEGCLVSDCVPIRNKTPFLRKAQENGFQTTNGIDMEVHQMPETFKLCFPDVEFGDDLVEISRTAYDYED